MFVRNAVVLYFELERWRRDVTEPVVILLVSVSPFPLATRRDVTPQQRLHWSMLVWCTTRPTDVHLIDICLRRDLTGPYPVTSTAALYA